MFRMKKDFNVGKLNDLISLTYKILKILFVLMIIVGFYAGIMVLKEIKIFPFVITIINIISPLFVGLFIAWLLDPVVKYLENYGIRRIIGSLSCYIVFIGLMVIFVNSLIPILSSQTNELVSNTLPAVFDSAEKLINDVFIKLENIQSLNVEVMKADLFQKLELFGTNLTSSLPEILVNIVKAGFSSLGLFIIGLLIGFFLLINFDRSCKNLYLLIPIKYRDEVKSFLHQINVPLKSFIQGTLFDMLIVFVVSAVGFSIIGLKSPLLFAVFCAITNVIPYAGPYIGGIPAVIVGFTQGTPIGISVLIFITLVQLLESNFLQPIIMSKTTKLSPVTIIVGLLIFGNFFGIIGMVVSTPIIGVLKAIFNYLDNKYEILNFREQKVKCD